jgi:hypothetical protein
MACRAPERRVSDAGRSGGGCSSSGHPLALAAGRARRPHRDPRRPRAGRQAPHRLSSRAASATETSRRCAHGLITGARAAAHPRPHPRLRVRLDQVAAAHVRVHEQHRPAERGERVVGLRGAQQGLAPRHVKHAGRQVPRRQARLATLAGAVRRSGKGSRRARSRPRDPSAASLQRPALWRHAVLPRSAVAQRRAIFCATHAVHEPVRRPAAARQRARLEGVHHVGPLLVVDARAPARVPKVHLVGQRVRQQAGHDVKRAQRVAQVGRGPRPLVCAAQRLPSAAPPAGLRGCTAALLAPVRRAAGGRALPQSMGPTSVKDRRIRCASSGEAYFSRMCAPSMASACAAPSRSQHAAAHQVPAQAVLGGQLGGGRTRRTTGALAGRLCGRPRLHVKVAAGVALVRQAVDRVAVQRQEVDVLAGRAQHLRAPRRSAHRPARRRRACLATQAARACRAPPASGAGGTSRLRKRATARHASARRALRAGERRACSHQCTCSAALSAWPTLSQLAEPLAPILRGQPPLGTAASCSSSGACEQRMRARHLRPGMISRSCGVQSASAAAYCAASAPPLYAFWYDSLLNSKCATCARPRRRQHELWPRPHTRSPGSAGPGRRAW